MANTGWINNSSSYITFRNLYKFTSIGNNSCTASDIAANGGGAELAIDIDDALINYGTINSVQIKYTCYGSRTSTAYKKATARTGYVISGDSYSWSVTHEQEVGRGSSNKTPFTDPFVPKRSTSDGKYHLLLGARNHIAALTLTVYFSDISIYIDYTPHTHSYTSTVTKQPTCTETGVKTYTCSCGDSYTEAIELSDHTPGAVPTCETPQVCTVCGIELIPKYGHNYITTTIPVTDSSYGCKRHTCSRCGDSYETDFVYRIKVEASPPEGGTVSGSGDYNSGDLVTITATPSPYWCVEKWLKNGEQWGGFGSHTERAEVPAQESLLCTVVFKIESYRLTLNAENGAITGAINGESYEYGSTLTLTAVPDAGYKFVKWSDGVTDDTRTITISTTLNNTYTAIFEKLPPQITSVKITRSSDLATVTINTPVDAESKFIISVEVI